MTGPGAPRTFRAGQGTPLVLLHPLFGSWRTWRPVLGPLTAHHEVFAPTLAGHRGGPELPPGPAPLSVFVDHVERDLDAEGLDTVHAAGNSLGGRVALELARRGRARSVTAFSPGCARRTWPDGVWLLVALGLLRASLALDQVLPVRKHPAWPRRLVMEHGERLSPDERTEALDDMRGCHALRRIVQAGRVEPRMSPLPPGRCPVRIAWGSRDRLTPYTWVEKPRRALLSDAEIIVLTQLGHTPMWDDPCLVASTIRSLTKAVDAGGAGKPQASH